MKNSTPQTIKNISFSSLFGKFLLTPLVVVLGVNYAFSQTYTSQNCGGGNILINTGTAGPTGDDVAAAATIPFTFNFYGTGYTTLYISTNGNVTFTSVGAPYPGASIPSGYSYPMIALAHTDLYSYSATPGTA